MKKDTRLNERQIEILKDLFKRSVDGETMEAIAESHGISRKTLSQWKNTNHGKKLHANFQKELTRESLPQYFVVLQEKALSGSYKHMELYAKLLDLFPATKQEIVTEDKTKPADTVISKEFLEDLNRRLGRDPEEEKRKKEAEQEHKKRMAEMEALGSRNVVNFYGKK